MKVSEKSDKEKSAKKSDAPAAEPVTEIKPLSAHELMIRNLSFIDKYAETKDRLYLMRVVRLSKFLRDHISLTDLSSTIKHYVTDLKHQEKLLSLVEKLRTQSDQTNVSAMDEDTAQTPSGDTSASGTTPKPIRLSGNSELEVRAYFYMFVLSYFAKAVSKSGLKSVDYALLSQESTAFLESMSAHNLRTLDFFQARILFYIFLAHEAYCKSGISKEQIVSSTEDFRSYLTVFHRSATLRLNEYGQALAINLLLNSYIQAKEYSAAKMLIERTTFPESISAAQFARYLYYSGKVYAVGLEFSKAHFSFQQAIRKAPLSAKNFILSAKKWDIIVTLLTGEIPSKSNFFVDGSTNPLRPYLEITRAVRVGDVPKYRKVFAEYKHVFDRDNITFLVDRLQTTVIRIGLRRLTSTYSRISFAVIAEKLSLDSVEEARGITAKAIRDGVIDGILDAETGILSTDIAKNVYETMEPYEVLNQRIEFCMDVRSEAMRAMRYPPKPENVELESAEAKKEREDMESFIKELEEGGFMDEDDDDDDDDDF